LKKNNNKWYSIVISLVIIWLLLVLSTWILNMIILEMKDNKWMWDNIKAYAWAESSQELALLKIKEKWYWYYKKIDHSINNESIFLSDNPLDKDLFNTKKDVFISYDIWSKVNEYEWIINKLSYEIIPLFYIDDGWEHKIDNYEFDIISWSPDDIVWNIIWKTKWISWTWTNINWVMKIITATNELKYSEIEISDFLSASETNYLILFNSWRSDFIKYKIISDGSSYFSKPKTNIISSWEIGDYKQNLSTILDNTKFLDRQKYAIYSN